MERTESIQVGSIWKKQSAKGTKYLSGKLNNGVYFTIFVNNKQTDKQPDYRMVMDIDKATNMDLLDDYTLRKKEEQTQATQDRVEREDDSLTKAVNEIPF